jgi:two-component system sensor histidine kinase UhpB
MRKVFVCIACILISANINLLAQSKKGKELIDSLETVINISHSVDTNKVKTLMLLTKAHLKNNEFQKSISTSEKALLISENLRYKFGEAQSLFHLGLARSYLGDFNEALKHYSKAQKIYEEIHDNARLASTCSNIGITYKSIGNYPLAINSFLKALTLEEQVGNKKSAIKTRLNIGNVYSVQRNYKEALSIYLDALKEAEELGDKSILASNYDCIGSVYSNYLGKYEEALAYFNKAIIIRNENGEKSQTASLYNNIGVVLLNLEKYAEAEKNHLSALSIYNEMENKSGISRTYHLLGNVYRMVKNYNGASENLGKSLLLAKEINDRNSIYEIYSDMANLDSAQGNMLQAWNNINLSNRYHDSIINEESTKKITEQKMQYEFDKKELEAQMVFSHQQDSLKQAHQTQKAILQKEIQFKELVFETEKMQAKAKADKDLQLKALKYEYEKRQANAKSEKEKQQLKFDEELKRKQINFDYEQKQLAIVALQEKKAKEETIKKRVIFSTVGLLFLIGGFYFYFYKQQQKVSHLLAIERTRNLISRDLHDELGSNLSSISIQASVAKRKLNRQEDVKEIVENISIASQEMVSKMSDIVWSLQAENENTMHLIERISNYCAVTLPDNDIQFEIVNRLSETNLNMQPSVLKELYLITKEAINNSLKHAQCNEIIVAFTQVENNFSIHVSDNGKGFDVNIPTRTMGGFGLKNMKQRAEKINANYTIRSVIGKGTWVEIGLLLT